MPRSRHSRIRPGRLGRVGFTMVELAIAVALATLIVAGLYQLFIIQSRQLQFLDMQTEMNQNLRFAADVVSRTVRNAGLGTADGTLGALGNTSDADALNPVIAYNNALSTGTDAITVVHQDPSLTMNTSALSVYPGDTAELTFDLTTMPMAPGEPWQGQIERIRLDPVVRFVDQVLAPADGWFEIDRITIY